MTAERRRELGQEIILLDPMGITGLIQHIAVSRPEGTCNLTELRRLLNLPAEKFVELVSEEMAPSPDPDVRSVAGMLTNPAVEMVGSVMEMAQNRFEFLRGVSAVLEAAAALDLSGRRARPPERRLGRRGVPGAPGANSERILRGLGWNRGVAQTASRRRTATRGVALPRADDRLGDEELQTADPRRRAAASFHVDRSSRSRRAIGGSRRSAGCTCASPEGVAPRSTG